MCSMTVTSIHVYTFLFLHCENQVVHLQANSLFRLFLSAENLLQHIEFEEHFTSADDAKTQQIIAD